MGIGTNIKHLRKETLRLSRDKFGERLGVSGDVINNIELERLAKPEAKEPLLKLICKEFNVNEHWIRTGEGDIFLKKQDDSIESLVKKYNLCELDSKIIRSYLELNEENRKVLKGFIQSIANSINDSEFTDDNEIDIDAEVESYRRQLELEKKIQKSSALSDSNSNAV